ncbi:hypothetical protein M758_UG009900 [Ceratodon purpureus]|nr:hypothetical protein M758_UG009900 [Ceratodon purpureus]
MLPKIWCEEKPQSRLLGSVKLPIEKGSSEAPIEGSGCEKAAAEARFDFFLYFYFFYCSWLSLRWLSGIGSMEVRPWAWKWRFGDCLGDLVEAAW